MLWTAINFSGIVCGHVVVSQHFLEVQNSTVVGVSWPIPGGPLHQIHGIIYHTTMIRYDVGCHLGLIRDTGAHSSSMYGLETKAIPCKHNRQCHIDCPVGQPCISS